MDTDFGQEEAERTEEVEAGVQNSPKGRERRKGKEPFFVPYGFRRRKKDWVAVVFNATVLVVPSSLGVPALDQPAVCRAEFCSKTKPVEGEGQERITC